MQSGDEHGYQVGATTAIKCQLSMTLRHVLDNARPNGVYPFVPGGRNKIMGNMPGQIHKSIFRDTNNLNKIGITVHQLHDIRHSRIKGLHETAG